MLRKCIFSFIANLTCTLSNRQMYPWGNMSPRLGTLVLEHTYMTKSISMELLMREKVKYVAIW